MNSINPHSTIARFFYEHKYSLESTCAYCKFGDYYIPAMAFYAALLKFHDIKRIMDSGSILPQEMCRPRITPGKIVHLERERDLLLISSVMYLLVNILLMISVLLDVPAILCPWLLFQTFMILGEALIFLIKLCKSESVCLNKGTLFCGFGALYNWLHVICHVRKYFILCR